MNEIKFKIAAKSDVGRVRDNNEDNFQAASDLCVKPMKWVNDAECILSNKGALLVVADGMGGMNAGEVASEIAINTIRDFFSPENITEDVVKSRYTIERFMKDAIVEADKRIKETAKARPETHGMGTTIVLGWIYGKHLYVSWCGDSRAYIYNPIYGIRQITKDHSYVQELVDQGKIRPEDAFDYPDSNIITRCLSDAITKARPDCLMMPYELCDGDVILLCTDGLSGMIHDDEIEAVIHKNYQNTEKCTDALIQAACDAAGHDNITVVLCKIESGGAKATAESILPIIEANENGLNNGFIDKLKKGGMYLGGAMLFLSLLGNVAFALRPNPSSIDLIGQDSIVVHKDSILSLKKVNIELEKTITELKSELTEIKSVSENRREEYSIGIDKNGGDMSQKQDLGGIIGIRLNHPNDETDSIINSLKPNTPYNIHKVENGQVLSQIAAIYNINMRIIMAFNQMKGNKINPDKLSVGQNIFIPKIK